MITHNIMLFGFEKFLKKTTLDVVSLLWSYYTYKEIKNRLILKEEFRIAVSPEVDRLGMCVMSHCRG